MKNLLLAIGTFFLFQTSYSQTIYSLVFSYTEDNTIGQGCYIDYKNTKSEVQAISQALGQNLIERHFTSDFNKTNLDNVINNLGVNPDDIIFLYISTHGARSSQGDNNQFPQIVVPSSNTQVMVSSYNYIYSKIKNLNARLTITLIDACNGYANITPKEVTIYGKTYSKKTSNTLTNFQKSNYLKLFKNYKGNLLVSSSEPGKYSISTSAGSIFTNCFFQALHYYTDMEDQTNIKYINWTNLLNRAKQYTLNETQRVSSQDRDFQPYYPVWENGLSRSVSSTSISNTTREVPSSLKLLHTCRALSAQEMRERDTDNDHLLKYWISGRQEDLNRIEKVIYYLHHTFSDPIHQNTDSESNYLETFTVWGQFWLRAKIIFKDGQEIELNRYTSFTN